MTDRSSVRRRIAVGVSAVGIAAGLVVTTPSDAKPAISTGPVGAWSLRVEAAAGAAQEAFIGTMELRKDSSCLINLRANFAGNAHDHVSTTCSWRPPASEPVRERPGVDGIITATGIADPNKATLSFVVADGGKRLLLLLDDTPTGIVGHGEAFRR